MNTVRTKTVLLYDQNPFHRKRILNHFSKFEFRVLCLDELKQAPIQAKRVNPFVLLINPSKLEEAMELSIPLLRQLPGTKEIPIFIVGVSNEKGQEQKWLDLGVRNVFSIEYPVEALMPAIIFNRPYAKNIAKPEYTTLTGELPNGNQYELTDLKFNLSSQIVKSLSEMKGKEYGVEFQFVVLNLFWADQIGKKVRDALKVWACDVEKQGLHPVVLSENEDLKMNLSDTTVKVFHNRSAYHLEYPETNSFKSDQILDLLNDLPDLDA